MFSAVWHSKCLFFSSQTKSLKKYCPARHLERYSSLSVVVSFDYLFCGDCAKEIFLRPSLIAARISTAYLENHVDGKRLTDAAVCELPYAYHSTGLVSSSIYFVFEMTLLTFSVDLPQTCTRGYFHGF